MAAAASTGLPSAAQPATVIRNAQLIDGSGRPPLADADIVIADGRVTAIGAADSLAIPDGALEVDAAGKTVVPGIVNLRGLAGFVRSTRYQGPQFARAEIVRHLGKYAMYGVTTTTTSGPLAHQLRDIRTGIEGGRIPSAARVVTPQRTLALTAEDPEGDQSAAALHRLGLDAAAAGRAVDALAKDGADYIELRVDSALEPSSVAVASAAVRRARDRGLRVSVLAPDADAAAALVRAGANALAGSVSDRVVSDDFVRELRAAGVVYAPGLTPLMAGFEFAEPAPWLDDRYLHRSRTLGVKGWLRGPLRERQALDPDRQRKMRRFETAERNLRKIAAAGVPIGLASGSGRLGTFEGYSEYREAVFMTKAGLSPMEVIRAFSHGSATALGIAPGRGALQPGCWADLVILNANPLDDIRNLRELHAVFIMGRLAKL